MRPIFANDGYNFCPHCGKQYLLHVWPRECFHCNFTVWLNAKSVAVILVPVADANVPGGVGLLGVRRGKDPCIGELALPGGYLEIETWLHAAVRELEEETGEVVSERDVVHHVTLSSADGRYLCVFGKYLRTLRQLPDFTPNEEVQELVVLDRSSVICFPTHAEAVRRWFDSRGPVPLRLSTP